MSLCHEWHFQLKKTTGHGYWQIHRSVLSVHAHSLFYFCLFITLNLSIWITDIFEHGCCVFMHISYIVLYMGCQRERIPLTFTNTAYWIRHGFTPTLPLLRLGLKDECVNGHSFLVHIYFLCAIFRWNFIWDKITCLCEYVCSISKPLCSIIQFWPLIHLAHSFPVKIRKEACLIKTFYFSAFTSAIALNRRKGELKCIIKITQLMSYPVQGYYNSIQW